MTSVRKPLATLLTCLSILTFSPSQADNEYECACQCEPDWLNMPYQFYFGPECYRSSRAKEGGSRQRGWMYGARGGVDYLKRYCIYWGGDVACATGHLYGKSGRGISLKSRMKDASVEGRLGYTFQRKHGCRPMLALFVSGGYFSERNNYSRPHDFPVHFHITYPYVGAGFISRVDFTDHLQLGVNFKFKYPLEPECRVSHDPENPRHKLGIEERFQYRVEVPLKYQFSRCRDIYIVSIAPFFEYREYGRKAGYPFDFFETKFDIYGLTAEVYCQY